MTRAGCQGGPPGCGEGAATAGRSNVFTMADRRLEPRRGPVTWVPTEEAGKLVAGFEVEDAPAAWGVSRVYIDSPAQLWAAKALVLRSLELAQTRKDESSESASEKV